MVVAINLMGPFRVQVDDQPVPDAMWARRDAASLVKLLALRRSRRLHREQAMDLLWPDLDVAEAAPRLHKAAHYGRKAIGRADAVVLRGEMIALLPGLPVSVDVDDFEKAAEQALGRRLGQGGGRRAGSLPRRAVAGRPLRRMGQRASRTPGGGCAISSCGRPTGGAR